MLSRLILSFLLSGLLVQCQVARAAGVSVQSDFKLEKYLGKWYEYAKTPFIFDLGAKCITIEYDDLGNGDIAVTNTQTTSGLEKSTKGTAKEIEPGKLNIDFEFPPLSSDYLILETDYDNYAVLYSYYSILDTSVVWILTRDRNPSSDFVERAKDAILRNGLSLNLLRVSDQKNCPA